MGMAKREQEEAEGRGWWRTGEWVCEHCLDEPILENKVKAAAEGEEECSFCGQTPAAPLDVLIEAFYSGLCAEYSTVDQEGIPYDNEDGVYLMSVMDTEELVSGVFCDVLVGDGLVDAVVGAINEGLWVRRGEWAGDSQKEILKNGWDSFCHSLKHETRYVFMVREPKRIRDFRELSPGEMLAAVGSFVDLYHLYSEIEIGHRFWRARTGTDPDLEWSAKDLGTPRMKDSKQANRMNPAGIPMFYGAADMDTAIRESLVRTADTRVTAAAFEVGQRATVIDLTKDKLPEVPSIFDLDRVAGRDGLRFLHDFVRRLSEPIRETYEQVDYVPTQVLTEYLLRVHNRDGVGVDGLMYSSAITGKPCVVLDIPNERCVEKGAELIREGLFLVNLEEDLHLAMDPQSVATFRIGRTYS